MPSNEVNYRPQQRVSPYSKYVFANQTAMMEASTAVELSADLRVLMAAMGKMNDYGHANFGRGELRRLLGGSDRTTIYRAKQKLYKAGLLVENTGGETCVWVNNHVATRGKSGTKCTFHH